MAITPEVVKTYLENEGNVCPSCGSTQLQGGDFYSWGIKAIRPVVCLNCKETWEDRYTMDSIGEYEDDIEYPSG